LGYDCQRMTPQVVSYADSRVPVRADIVEAHQRTWNRLAGAGTWWAGEERIAIAAETRTAANCALCRERKEAISPYAAIGTHDSLRVLPDVVVDVVHRVTTDPGRLTERLLRDFVEAGLTDAHYVETVAVVGYTVNFDTFCAALGIPARPLPRPLQGIPSQVRPTTARSDGAWVPLIPAGEAVGAYADLYHSNAPVNIQRALSLVPDEARHWASIISAEYVPLEDLLTPVSRRSIMRPQMELLAARVSALNDCFY